MNLRQRKPIRKSDQGVVMSPYHLSMIRNDDDTPPKKKKRCEELDSAVEVANFVDGMKDDTVGIIRSIGNLFRPFMAANENSIPSKLVKQSSPTDTNEMQSKQAPFKWNKQLEVSNHDSINQSLRTLDTSRVRIDSPAHSPKRSMFQSMEKFDSNSLFAVSNSHTEAFDDDVELMKQAKMKLFRDKDDDETTVKNDDKRVCIGTHIPITRIITSNLTYFKVQMKDTFASKAHEASDGYLLFGNARTVFINSELERVQFILHYNDIETVEISCNFSCIRFNLLPHVFLCTVPDIICELEYRIGGKMPAMLSKRQTLVRNQASAKCLEMQQSGSLSEDDDDDEEVEVTCAVANEPQLPTSSDSNRKRKRSQVEEEEVQPIKEEANVATVCQSSAPIIVPLAAQPSVNETRKSPVKRPVNPVALLFQQRSQVKQEPIPIPCTSEVKTIPQAAHVPLASPLPSLPRSVSTVTRKTPNRNLIQLFWNPVNLTKDKLESSIWQNSMEDNEATPLEDACVKEIHDKFTKRPVTGRSDKLSKANSIKISTPAGCKGELRFMTSQRSQSLSIALVSLQKSSNSQEIIFWRGQDGILSKLINFRFFPLFSDGIREEQVERMIEIMPSSQEIGVCFDFIKYDDQAGRFISLLDDSTSAKSELFVADLICNCMLHRSEKSTPFSLSEALHCSIQSLLYSLIFLMSAEATLTRCCQQLDQVTAVFSAMTASLALRELFQHSRKIGNYLNQDSWREKCVGFNIDSLTKIAETKSNDGKMSLLDFVVSSFSPDKILELESSVFDLLRSSSIDRFSFSEVLTEFAKLGVSISSMKEVTTEMRVNDVVSCFVGQLEEKYGCLKRERAKLFLKDCKSFCEYFGEFFEQEGSEVTELTQGEQQLLLTTAGKISSALCVFGRQLIECRLKLKRMQGRSPSKRKSSGIKNACPATSPRKCLKHGVVGEDGSNKKKIRKSLVKDEN